MILYWYKSLTGEYIPATHTGELDTLKSKFRGSSTPLMKTIAVNSKEVKDTLVACLEAQKTATKDRGVLCALDNCVLTLKTVRF